MLKAVIFDMDGVIIDSEPIHFKFEQSTFAKLDIIVDESYHNSFIGTTSNYMWQSLKDKFALSQSVEELVSISRSGFLTFLKSLNNIELISGTGSLIKELYNSNIKLAVASSSPMEMIDYIVDTLEVDKYFSALVSGDYVNRSKPNPDIFLYAAEKLGVRADECIVIEDSHNGVKAAKAAGMKCIGYRNLNSGNQDISCADIIIDNFSELKVDILNTLAET
jgi:beta-phosphoglucomutase family hydrolase